MSQNPTETRAPAPDVDPEATRLPATLRVNGSRHALLLEPRRTLLDVLRHDLQLTGAKKVCDAGDCGACTVIADGRAVYSCLLLGVDCGGREITTIEGLGRGDELDPVQQAFIDEDAFQCGFCTPGQIMSAIACVAEGRAGSAEEVRAAMSGNSCRCSAYGNIVRAVLDGRARMEGTE